MNENELRARLTRLESELAATRGRTAETVEKLAQIQVRADSVGGMLGIRAPEPGIADTPESYERKCLEPLLRHSKHFASTRLATVPDAALPLVANQVYADAQAAGVAGAQGKPGHLIPHVTRDPAGRQITTFYGDNLAWMQHFMTGGQCGSIDRVIAKDAARNVAAMGKGASK